MAVSSTPDLLEVKAELGSSSTDLVSLIDEAGKTGIWTSLLDFAGYSAGNFSLEPGAMNFAYTGTPSQTLYIYASGAWTLTINDSWINVTGGLTGTGNATRTVDCDSNGGAFRSGSISGELDSDSSKNDSITINQDEFDFCC